MKVLIEGYEDYYITDTGQVISMKYNTPRIMKTYLDRNDRYVYIKLCKNNKTKAFAIHQLVAQAFIPNPHNYKEVDHIDNNPQNNNKDNLQWIDHKNNIYKSYNTMSQYRNCIEVDIYYQQQYIKSMRSIKEAAEYCNKQYGSSISILRKYYKHKDIDLKIRCND